MIALCDGQGAYTRACQGRGWVCKPSKTTLTADYYQEEEAVADGFAPLTPPTMEEDLGEQEDEVEEQVCVIP